MRWLRVPAWLRTVCLALPVVLAGCVPPPPPQEPLLSLSRTDCDARPDFTAAVAVRTEDGRGASAVLGSEGRCLHVANGAPTTYAVFALPTDPAPYTLDVLSSVVPGTIVRPLATLYDAAGRSVRVIPPEEFETNIAGLRTGVRPRGTERWLVVAADQARLGQVLRLRLGEVDRGVQVAATAYVPIIIVVPPAVPDLVRQRSATIALNGRITVAAVPVRIAQ